MFSCEFCEVFKNTVYYRTPLMAASNFFCVYFAFLDSIYSSNNLKEFSLIFDWVLISFSESARNLVFSDFRSETKGSRFESGC